MEVFLNNPKFADNIELIADIFDQAQRMILELHAASREVGLRMNFAKT